MYAESVTKCWAASVTVCGTAVSVQKMAECRITRTLFKGRTVSSGDMPASLCRLDWSRISCPTGISRTRITRMQRAAHKCLVVHMRSNDYQRTKMKTPARMKSYQKRSCQTVPQTGWLLVILKFLLRCFLVIFFINFKPCGMFTAVTFMWTTLLSWFILCEASFRACIFVLPVMVSERWWFVGRLCFAARAPTTACCRLSRPCRISSTSLRTMRISRRSATDLKAWARMKCWCGCFPITCCLISTSSSYVVFHNRLNRADDSLLEFNG